MQKKNRSANVFAYTLFLATVLSFIACAPGKNNKPTQEELTGIAYPKPYPDSSAIPFLPGLVSTDALDFGSAFSPAGNSFYFARSENKKLKIYVTRLRNNSWSPAEPAGIADTTYSQADPAFSPDGKLYFISNRPKDAADTLPDYDIWFVSPLPGDQWSAPKNMEMVNSDSNEFYISFSAKGDLCFSSSRKGGFGEEDIYLSLLHGKQLQSPKNLGPGINTSRSEYDPCIAHSGKLLLFSSANRAGGFGGADLYWSKQLNADSWATAANLGDRFNTKTREYCPYFTKDMKFFFFSSEGDIKWIPVGMLEKQTGKF